MSNNYVLSTVYGNLPAGTQPLSDFDGTNGQLAAMGTLMCTAAGTNTVSLTSVSGYPTMTAYGNYQKLGFVAAANSTTLVSIAYSALATLNAYLDDGVTQVGSTPANGLLGGTYYEFAYNSALNGSAGGFQQISANAGQAGISRIVNQTFTVSGTYTATGGLIYAKVIVLGGGGGGGGISSVPTYTAAGPGASGSYGEGLYDATTIGSIQIVTIGTGGPGGSTSGSNGTSGGQTSLGSLITAPGGGGGLGYSSGTQNVGTSGAPGAAGTGGYLNIPGFPGGTGFTSANGSISASGTNSQYGGGGVGVNQSAGNNAAGYGAGGSGAAVNGASAGLAGGNGSPGLIIITEYCA